MANEDGFPAFWHKNFALVCEKLLHVDHSLDKARLCRHAINHFRQYLQHAPTDPDRAHIDEAIEILTQRLDMYTKLDQVDVHLENMAQRADVLAERVQQHGKAS